MNGQGNQHIGRFCRNRSSMAGAKLGRLHLTKVFTTEPPKRRNV